VAEEDIAKEYTMHNAEQDPGCGSQELTALRQRLTELEATATRYKQVQAALQTSQERLAVILQEVTDLKRAEQDQHLLAEVSRVLAASLDYLSGLANLVRLVVPALADWCVVDMVAEDGTVQRLAIAHADPAKEALARQLQDRYAALKPQAAHTILRVIRTGQSWIDPEVSESRFVAEARDTEHLRLLRALGFKSEMVVPLLARGRTLGAMTFVRTEARRRFRPTDLAFAEELARRVAIAVDNTRLYQEAQKLNIELEQRVAARTAELQASNTRLANEMAERRQAEQALIQSEKLAAMGSLLASVAHELNNPLSIVVMEAELLSEEARDGPLEEHARKITQAATRCSRMVHSFLTLARQHPPERLPVAVNTMVTECVELLAYALQVDNIEVQLHLAAQLPTLWADPQQLRQVVINLITNAHHALREVPAPRRLALATRAEAERGCIVLEVTDTGAGIPPELQARIFEPFFTTKPVAVGTGLGLSLCRGIVEGHGGHIRVQSQPGQGTSFRIELPAGMAPLSLTKPAAAAEVPGVPGQAILIVDDETGIRNVLARLLRRDGHTVETAANGRLALAKLQEQTFDLIFCDLRMPELDGPGLYQELEHYHPQLLQRIIFFTGDTMNPETRAFLERTRVRRLTKPVTIAEVRRIVGQTWQAGRDGTSC
jgi:signal transduction histidine kinase/ActR/RegA family two-component response regulator